MEAFFMYLVVFAALGLMLAGLYGAMPLVLRRSQGRQATAGGPSFVIGGAIPLVQPELRPGFRSRHAVRVLEPEAGPDEAPATLAERRAIASPSDTEALLTGLFNEVDLLRAELEGLRTELAALIEVANSAAGGPGRTSARPDASLPTDLRPRATSVRRDRRLAQAK